VGIAEHKGDCLTFLVLDSVTSRVVARSELRSGLTTTLPNFRSILPPDGGESSPKIIQSTTDLAGLDINPSDLKMPRFSPDELIGKTFVRTLEDGNNYKATVLRKIQDHEAENHTNIKFLVELGDGEFDEIIGYNTLCECIEDLEDEKIEPEDKMWTFKEVLAHQGPLKKMTRTTKGLCTMLKSYGMMVQKLMNHLKWLSKMIPLALPHTPVKINYSTNLFGKS
jgi:hypothetical protein